MKRLICAVLVLAALVVGCEAVVGDLSLYTDRCSPISDKCPKGSPCVYDFGASAFKCEPHSGTKGQDSSCTDESECAPGFSCSKFSTNTSGHCTHYCPDESLCEPGCKCHTFGVSRELPTGVVVGACGPLETPCDSGCRDVDVRRRKTMHALRHRLHEVRRPRRVPSRRSRVRLPRAVRARNHVLRQHHQRLRLPQVVRLRCARLSAFDNVQGLQHAVDGRDATPRRLRAVDHSARSAAMLASIAAAPASLACASARPSLPLARASQP